jgi:REP element-mobilizing transposase RayT
MRKTVFEPGKFYHIYNRGNEKRDIFFERENYLFFLRRLEKRVHQRGGKVLAYCLMPNHFHLLMQETVKDGIPKLMHSLETSYAKAVNRRYNRVGHLFQGPFKDKLVDTTVYLVHLSWYLHLNPVFANLVSRPEQWEFSSCRDYIGLSDGSLACKEVVLAEFDGSEDYREFLMSDLDLTLIQEYILE